MTSVVKIASYICDRYQKAFDREIDEMKLHKLLYFTQRESIIQTDEPLFTDCFEAWKYGPVMVVIREMYRKRMLCDTLPEDEKIRYQKVFDTVFTTYAPKDSWSLSSITHGEYAWQEARKKITPVCQHVPIVTDDIRVDARRVKFRRFLYEKIRKANSHADNA